MYPCAQLHLSAHINTQQKCDFPFTKITLYIISTENLHLLSYIFE